MAPALRSSTPSTPNSKSRASNETTPTATPRKTPTCTKCKRPRAGHPRSGCPYIDSPLNDALVGPSMPPRKGVEIEDALGSMQLGSPLRGLNEDNKEILNRRRSSGAAPALAGSLLSLDTESQEIVERLLQPGMFDGDAEDAPKITAKVVQWQDALVGATLTKTKSKRIKMPGSLSSPSPESSQGSISADKTGEPFKAADSANPGGSIAATSASSPSIRRTQPLVRSMSIEQRDDFLFSLNASSDATVYVVPRDDIHNTHAEAIKLGFFARIVLGKDPGDPQGLLILGRNETTVKRLYEKVEIERKKTSRFRAVAGGAMVGVVGTYAGLAFS